MCLLFIALRHFEKVPVLITFNRDEYVERPALPAHFWNDKPEILAGRDLLRGGTWGGITRAGRMGFITFVRRFEAWQENPTPRGEVVPAFLNGSISPDEFVRELQGRRTEYLGFNGVCGVGEEFLHYSNVTNVVTRLGPGIHGVGNALLNTPWPKVVRGAAAISHMDAVASVVPAEVFRIMADAERAKRSELPLNTGMSEEKEWERSSIFVDAPGYATRCSTVVTLHEDGAIRFHERSHFPAQAEVNFVL